MAALAEDQGLRELDGLGEDETPDYRNSRPIGNELRIHDG